MDRQYMSINDSVQVRLQYERVCIQILHCPCCLLELISVMLTLIELVRLLDILLSIRF